MRRRVLVLYSLVVLLVGLVGGWAVNNGTLTKDNITGLFNGDSGSSSPVATTNLSGYVKFQYLKVQRIVNIFDVKEIVAAGKVQNLSDRTIRTLGITIELLGDDGKPIWEHHYYPVHAGTEALGDGAEKPLPPGQIRGEFWHPMSEDIPQWHGKYRYWISQLKFEPLQTVSGGQGGNRIAPKCLSCLIFWGKMSSSRVLSSTA